MPSPFINLDWADDAPEPEPVMRHALALVARQVRPLSEERLRAADHLDRMKVVLAADYYYTIFSRIALVGVPVSAMHVADLHKQFAVQAMRIRLKSEWESNDPDGRQMAELTALASRCFEARGDVCPECGLPRCLHADPLPPSPELFPS